MRIQDFSDFIDKIKHMNVILINATAARISGALSIFNQFLFHIPLDGNDRYCLFVDMDYKEIVQHPNLEYIHIDTRIWRRRIWWDEFGFRRYVNQRGIFPSLIVSFQNTGVRFDVKVPQLVYYHQLLPLSSKKWSAFKREEFVFFLYKHFYPYFVLRFIHSGVSFVVQTSSTKAAFIAKYKVPVERVYVIPPEVQDIDYNEVPFVSWKDDKKHFIYPASPSLYKNHVLLLQALYLIKQKSESLFQKIRLHFTLSKKNPLKLYEQACRLGIEDALMFEGVLPFQQLLSYYKSMDALLFPSYIETVGLPLLEAAGAGIAIVASDLPYVHDVIGEYEGVSFVDYEDEGAWASAIEALCGQEKKKYLPFHYPAGKGNWNDFFMLIGKLKNQN